MPLMTLPLLQFENLVNTMSRKLLELDPDILQTDKNQCLDYLINF